MSLKLFADAVHFLTPKTPDQNFIAAAFYMLSVSLVSMSMVHMNWFLIHAPPCLPYIALSDFFVLTSDIQDMTNVCYSNSIVNMIRIIILLCFMAIIFSLIGFFMEIRGTKSSIPNFVRKYSLPSSCTVIWVMAIIATCYYVGIQLEDNISKHLEGTDVYISYGSGLYVITATGGTSLLGTFFTLIITFGKVNEEDPWESDHSQLIDDNSEILEAFRVRPPPPPYSVPPPPYTP